MSGLRAPHRAPTKYGNSLEVRYPQARWMVDFMDNPQIKWMTGGTTTSGKLHDSKSYDICIL